MRTRRRDGSGIISRGWSAVTVLLAKIGSRSSDLRDCMLLSDAGSDFDEVIMIVSVGTANLESVGEMVIMFDLIADGVFFSPFLFG